MASSKNVIVGNLMCVMFDTQQTQAVFLMFLKFCLSSPSLSLSISSSFLSILFIIQDILGIYIYIDL